MQHKYISPIIPGIGIGELVLGDTEQNVVQKLGEAITREVMSSGIIRMDFGPVKIWLDRNHRIQQIGIYEGYNGETAEGIRIGMSKNHLKQLWGFGLAYNSDFEAYEFLNHPGILFEFASDISGNEYITTMYIV